MRGIKSANRRGTRPAADRITIALALAKNTLHGGHYLANGISEPLQAAAGLALPGITP